MRIGVLREILPGEGRVAAIPSCVRALVQAGHSVLVEQSAGAVSGFGDDEYIRAGAEIAPTAEEVYDRATLIWKVMRPTAHESGLLRSHHHVVALLHAGPPLPCRSTAAEAWQDRTGAAPVRAAMSEIAGKLAIKAASHALLRPQGGRGLLLGGVVGVEPAQVVVIGAGTAGRSAAALALAMGAAVTALDIELAPLRALPGATTLLSSPHAIERALFGADVVVAAVRGDDGRAPRVATRGHLALMQPGAVVVDLSILDGGAFETTPTATVDQPPELIDGIVHIGAINFAGAVPRTSSVAYAQAGLPLILRVLREEGSA